MPMLAVSFIAVPALGWAPNRNMVNSINLQNVTEITEVFIKACKEIGLDVNAEEIKDMITSHQQNVIQNQNVIIGNLSTCYALDDVR